MKYCPQALHRTRRQMICVRGCPVGVVPGKHRSRTIRTDSRSVLRHLGQAAGITATTAYSLLCEPAGRPEVFLSFAIVYPYRYWTFCFALRDGSLGCAALDAGFFGLASDMPHIDAATSAI